jgi:hypothetical protein
VLATEHNQDKDASKHTTHSIATNYTTNVYARSKKEPFQEGVVIENVAGKYLNVEGNRKRNGSVIQLWDYLNRTSLATQWRVQHVEQRPATYTIESAHAPGMYLTVGDNESSIQLQDNATLTNALWRIQNVAGKVEAYTFESVTAPGKYLMGVDTNESSRAASIVLGKSLSSTTAQWIIHAPHRSNYSSTNGNHTLRGVWRKVKGCWDTENGSKILNASCPPTPSPTPLPTKTPTPSPTLAPTVKAHWHMKMKCMDAHGNLLHTSNCAPIINGHAIESKHHLTR